MSFEAQAAWNHNRDVASGAAFLVFVYQRGYSVFLGIRQVVEVIWQAIRAARQQIICFSGVDSPIGRFDELVCGDKDNNTNGQND